MKRTLSCNALWVTLCLYRGAGASVASHVLFLAGSFVQFGPQCFGLPVVQSAPQGVVELRLTDGMQLQLFTQLLEGPEGLPTCAGLHEGVEQGVRVTRLRPSVPHVCFSQDPRRSQLTSRHRTSEKEKLFPRLQGEGRDEHGIGDREFHLYWSDGDKKKEKQFA